MHKILIVTAALTAGCSPVAVAAGADTTLPGLWEATTTDADGEVTSTKTCVAPGETLVASFRRQLGEGCRYSRSTLGGGRIDLAATCAGGAASLAGRYTPTTMDAVLRSNLRVGQSVMPLNLTIKARRISARCNGAE